MGQFHANAQKRLFVQVFHHLQNRIQFLGALQHDNGIEAKLARQYRQPDELGIFDTVAHDQRILGKVMRKRDD